MSVPERPKQFLSLTAEQTMFQLTALRTGQSDRFGAPIIVANVRHADLIEAQLAAIGIVNPTLILEPCARNTAPAIALAAIEARDAPILVMPSDHVIANVDAFHKAIDAALPKVEEGWLATFGITPTGPETGYGYIRKGEPIAAGIHRVERFVEKPDLAGAQAMIADGQHLWNGGIFLIRADAYLEALGQHAGAILESVRKAMDGASRSGGRVMPEASAFEASPSDSIDYAVMEKAARVAVAPVSMGWSDVGSWDSLYALARKDEAGNAARGDVRLSGTSGMMVETDGIRISASGVDNLIVIASGNEVLILPRGKSQDVRKFAK
jgi:mannose-1-phosphate guanylyltransferase/mannose-1-phosphate guanylyltransferase/mannose-6-phosphate isomerase